MAEIVQLSKRLKMLTELVTPGNRVADVGCDHGFVSIYLVQKGTSPHVIASDVRVGPLTAAEEHVKQWGLTAYIETRLSDGLSAYEPGEADTLICAGMGGRLMQQILMQYPDVTDSFRELILQPQSELRQFRVFLRENSYKIKEERILFEDGKYYFAFLVEKDKEHAAGPVCLQKTAGKDSEEKVLVLYDKYGEALLRTGNPVLKEYLEKSLQTNRKVKEEIMSHRGDGTNSRLEESLREIEEEILDLETALNRFF